MKPARLSDSVIYYGATIGVHPLHARCEEKDGLPYLVSCWELSWLERLQVLLAGRFWCIVQSPKPTPMYLRADSPYEESTGEFLGSIVRIKSSDQSWREWFRSLVSARV